jgi:hypothetical protein
VPSDGVDYEMVDNYDPANPDTCGLFLIDVMLHFLFRTCFEMHLFICAYLFTLNCRLLDKEGGQRDEDKEGEEA